ncbi:DsbA family protein [Nostoc favosum]|uniref:DsbA family protein n=1 Tax=Nostoc favosum CHAB5714 TaxID=2780399 RepID=A0ABS8I9H7_9NOSO|nr:DsbA family protein [Nostoc favosum]MCC5600806.1 DsbA family protein [Nostoc favosum CHAB5714]
MLIDIFHDPVCPWCRIGKKHLFDALAKWQEEEVDIRWHPFILDNTIPDEGYEFRSFMQK